MMTQKTTAYVFPRPLVDMMTSSIGRTSKLFFQMIGIPGLMPERKGAGCPLTEYSIPSGALSAQFQGFSHWVLPNLFDFG
jgi:hypothetical protein